MNSNNKTTYINKTVDSDNWRRRPVDLEQDFRTPFRTNETNRNNFKSTTNYNSVRSNDPGAYNEHNLYVPHAQPPVQGAVFYQYTEETYVEYSVKSNNNRYQSTDSNRNKNNLYQSTNNNQYRQRNNNYQSTDNNQYRTRNDRNQFTDNNQYRNQNERSNNDNWRSTAAVPKQAEYLHPDDISHTKRPNFFTPYMDPIKMETEISCGNLQQGIMRVTKNRYDAYVSCDDLDSDIYIGGLKSRNRSLDGDLVYVKLVDVDPVWDLREERRKERFQQSQNEIENDTTTQNEDSEADGNLGHKPIYCGEVVGIAPRSQNMAFVGIISSSRSYNQTNPVENGRKNKAPRIAWFKPSDSRVPLILLRDNDVPADLIENADYYKSYIYSATITGWRINDTSPSGKILEEIGLVGDLKAEKQAIISGNGIITAEFSPLALIGLPNIPWVIPESEMKKRRDLRHELVFTIDPSTARDLDDAVHFKVLEDGFYEVGVHIADVGYFLKRGSALDEEALQRGTSTYLVDGVISMLPSVLCEELCSLNPDVDRLAFSVIWKMDAYGKQLSTWFGRTVIRSCAKLSYEHAQCVINGDEIPLEATLYGNHSIAQLSASIFMLNKLATELRKKRFEGGALQLQSVKLKFDLDNLGEPFSVSTIETKEANHLIEEFMLCANISVATKIASVYTEEALLRRHEPPIERRLLKFVDLAEELGYDFDESSAGSLQESFNKIKDKKIKQVFLVLAIRCMQRAKYFCAGSIDISKYSHYALNEPFYTHFTSPIRRYADVVVHRLLESALEERKFCGYNEKSINQISFKCNVKKNSARKAQDASMDLYLANYFIKYEAVKGPIITKAIIINVAKDNFEIYLPEYGMEKQFYLKCLPLKQFTYNNLVLNIYWKPGVHVPMYNEEKYSPVESDNDEDDEEEEEEEEEEEVVDCEITLDKLMTNLKMLDKEEMATAVVPEEDTYLQQLSIFSEIDVRIQVNETRSPPIINVYPVNPFCGEIQV